jgi:hypothetical protein
MDSDSDIDFDEVNEWAQCMKEPTREECNNRDDPVPISSISWVTIFIVILGVLILSALFIIYSYRMKPEADISTLEEITPVILEVMRAPDVHILPSSNSGVE